MTSDRGLAFLAGTHLGQDWKQFGPTPDECVRRFARGQSAEDVTAAIAGFEALLASPMTEDELEDHWVMKLGGGYDPSSDGRTYREFFAHAVTVLRNPR
jgi:hypothetical protein